MKRIVHPFLAIICVGFLFLNLNCKKEDLKKDLSFKIDDYISTIYLDGARELYIREIKNDVSHPNYNKAELDTAKINHILRKLQLVYELKTAQSDSVFNVLKIKPLRCSSLKSIVMQVNTNEPHIKNMAESRIPTGNAKLDNLLQKYKIASITKSLNFSISNSIIVNTSESYNLIPIIAELNTVPGITSAENNGGCFDGNDLKINVIGSKTIIDFSVGSGDCPAGCIYREHWLFSVENNEAKFLGWKRR
jgi:hypothetical protein